MIKLDQGSMVRQNHHRGMLFALFCVSIKWVLYRLSYNRDFVIRVRQNHHRGMLFALFCVSVKWVLYGLGYNRNFVIKLDRITIEVCYSRYFAFL